MEMVSSSAADMSREQKEDSIDIETAMKSWKSGFVNRGSLPNIDYYVDEESLIQEVVAYRSNYNKYQD